MEMPVRIHPWKGVGPHPMSVRFQDDRVVERLKTEAATRGSSVSSLAEELIDEGLRSRRQPAAEPLNRSTRLKNEIRPVEPRRYSPTHGGNKSG